MIKYPAQLDDSLSLPLAVDNNTPVQADVVNRLRNAIIAVEAELGVKPSSLYSTVRARLDYLDNLISNFDFIRLDQDLGGTVTLPKVIGIQGRPVASTTPSTLDVLTWNGIAWVPSPVAGSTGASFTPFTATLAGGGIIEVSQTSTNPAFTATYSLTPTSATLSDSDLNLQDVTSTPSSFSSDYSFTKNNFGDSVTFTLTAVKGTSTESPTATLSWGQKLYWGVGPAALSGASFILTYTTGDLLSLTRTASFSVTPGLTDKIYFACRAGYGTGTAVFVVGGFEGGFTFMGTFSHTNAYGFIENYDLYESDNVNLGATTVSVS